MTPETLKRHTDRLNQLDIERQSWVSHWRELADATGPRSFRYIDGGQLNSKPATAGAKQNSGIINNTPVVAARTLKAGMLSGMMSPSRPWFQLTLEGEPEAETQGTKSWLSEVEEEIRETCLKSNFYSAALLTLHDLAVFGFSCQLIDEDEEDEIRCYVFPVGQYWLSQSDRLSVDTVYRRFTMTVRQVVKKFGEAACSQRVRRHFEKKEYETAVDVVHVIEPNEDFQEGKLGARGKPWLSTWFEWGVPADQAGEHGCLREGGYDEKPFVAPRWTTTGEDVYGTSPAMDALGDCRALQRAEVKAAAMVDKIVDPPMRGPKSLSNQRTSLLPGGMTYVDALSPSQTFAPAMEVNPQAVAVVEQKIQLFEQRINRAFYADLWLLLQQTDGQMTAREVIERREEKLLQLGPVLDRLHDEYLDPAINRIFNVLLRKGRLPLPPQELQGRDLKVKFISIMAQAQKLQGTTAVERLAGFVGQLAPLRQEILDKINWDATVDEYGSMLGVAPKIINTEDMVEGVRKRRARLQAQAAQLQAAEQAAGTAQKLAAADTEGNNALTTMLRGVGAA